MADFCHSHRIDGCLTVWSRGHRQFFSSHWLWPQSQLSKFGHILSARSFQNTPLVLALTLLTETWYHWAGGLAHMVERSLSMREVPGSMPGSSTSFFFSPFPFFHTTSPFFFFFFHFLYPPLPPPFWCFPISMDLVLSKYLFKARQTTFIVSHQHPDYLCLPKDSFNATDHLFCQLTEVRL